MNRLRREKQEMVLNLLVEGTGINSVVRLTGVSKNAILRLIKRVGKRCEMSLDNNLQGLWSEAIECDEIWTYVGKHQKRLLPHEQGNGQGDQYVFVAFDRDTKLIPVFRVGQRDSHTAYQFMQELRRRVINTFQLTTDMFTGYRHTVPANFGMNIHYAQLKKLYHGDGTGREGYSPAALKGVRVSTMIGLPDRKKICTSYVERQNLTIRMQLRRFARLTNAASKKLENLQAALAIHFWYYNFMRVHQSLGMTPAMKAGITTQRWTWDYVLC
ncbi:MAG TPA: IS1 family transposase [Candidatus Deferrimicrobium sp.]|nr:IS1 family transposase [Candidatus Deferrimicrobium sp.]